MQADTIRCSRSGINSFARARPTFVAASAARRVARPSPFRSSLSSRFASTSSVGDGKIYQVPTPLRDAILSSPVAPRPTLTKYLNTRSSVPSSTVSHTSAWQRPQPLESPGVLYRPR